MLFGIFVRSVEDGLEPSQTYDEVNKLLLLLLLLLLNVLSDFINLTQVHNFTVTAQDIFTFRRLSVFTVRFTRILQVLMQIMKHFALYY